MNNSSSRIVFGCRDPESDSPWNSAFVYCECNKIVAVVFERGMDFIGHPRNIQEALVTYNSFIEKGWQIMSVEDLIRTAGVVIDGNTILTPPI